MVGSREVLRSLPVVRVLVDENIPSVATSVHVRIPQAYTARCEATAHGMNRFASLVQHRLEHQVPFRAQLGGVVLVHFPELGAYVLRPPGPVPTPIF